MLKKSASKKRLGRKIVSVGAMLALLATMVAFPASADPVSQPLEGERNIALRRAVYHSSAANINETGHLVTDGIIESLTDFNSCWISEGAGEQSVYIDFGAKSTVSNVKVYWGENYATQYEIQSSMDAENWTTIAKEQGAANQMVQTFVKPQDMNYLRILCEDSSGDNYVIQEVEVYGVNDLRYSIGEMPESEADGTQYLTGGNWKVQRASEVLADGVELSQAGYDDSAWLPACVPGTVLASYLKAGAVPDPNFDDNQYQVSDSFFTTDFWYRDSFVIPESQEGLRTYLNFDGINWKADVYFNGHLLPNAIEGREKSIEGAFIRGKFDVTDYVNYGGENYLAVYIYMNDHPWYRSVGGRPNRLGDPPYEMVSNQSLAGGPSGNGGNLGVDNPTFHAAIGWDWMPTIRGRDTGIYNDVYLSYSGDVRLDDSWMETDLDIEETSKLAQLTNHATESLAAVSATSGEDTAAYAADGNVATEWIPENEDGTQLVIELDEPTKIGTVEILWGEVYPAAAYESQNAAQFSLEVSEDGENWVNLDSHPGGEVDFGNGTATVDPIPGTDAFTGANVSNVITAPTLRARLPGSWRYSTMFAPHTAKYLRFTTLERMTSVNSDQGILPPKIQEIRIYSEDQSTVDANTVRTYSLDDSKADLIYRTTATNRTDSPVEAVINGEIQPSGLTFSKTVELDAGETQDIVIDGIVMEDPDLWWPNTYGDQPLYTANVDVQVGEEESFTESFQFGVREFTYPVDTYLTLYCNGTRIVCKGGNWGMDDTMKLDTAESYDNKVRLHAEANMTMIRNWVGQTNNQAFYDACDKYGILVWDDFWLANPADGPDPADPDMFIENAIDKVKNIRMHPSLAFYCGRNESNPPDSLFDRIVDEAVEPYDHTRYYFPHSSSAPVGSGGGYSLGDPKVYFNNVSNPVLRSERGIPNVPTEQSIEKFLREENQWPINESWGIHDFTFYMNGPANTYIKALKSYRDSDFYYRDSVGQPWGQTPDETRPEFIEYQNQMYQMVEEVAEDYTFTDFSNISQLINYENHRALFEALTVTRSNGLLMWMSQSSWPSFMWQTYDYFLYTNGGYFGLKAGNQPTHAVIDPRDDRIVLSNLTRQGYTDVTTTATIYDANGKMVSEENYDTASLPADSYGIVLDTADYSASSTDLVFIKLVVKDSDGSVLGENLYWWNRSEYQDYTAMDDLQSTKLQVSVSEQEQLENGNVLYTFTLENNTDIPAIQARLRTVNEAGEDVLPVFYSDNYITMMPGDSKTVTAEFNPKYLEGGSPIFLLGGYNVVDETIGSDNLEENIRDFTIVQREDGPNVYYVDEGDFLAKVTFVASQSGTITFTPVITAYQDGILLSTAAETMTLDVEAGKTYVVYSPKVTIPTGSSLEDVSIKAFILNENFAPLRGAKQLRSWSPSA